MADQTVTPDCPCCATVAPVVIDVVVPDPTVGGQVTAHCPCVTAANGAPKPLLSATVTAVANMACLQPFTVPLAHIGCTDLGEQTWTFGVGCALNYSGCRFLFGNEDWVIQYAACSRTVAGPANACGFTHHTTDHNFRIGWNVCNNLFQIYDSVFNVFASAEFGGGAADPRTATVTLHSFQCSPLIIVYRVTLPANNPYFPSGVFDVTLTD